MQFKDYYAILGVPKTASQDDIRKAFRKLARLHHPDVAKDKKTAEAKFKEINEANEVLGDAEKRKRYDELGSDWNQPGRQGPPPNWQDAFGGGGGQQGGGFSDFFEAFFRGGGGGGKKRRTMARNGSDAELEVAVSIEEVLNGGKKSLRLNRDGQLETITVNIPRGVRAGQKIRLAGQGGEGIGGGEAGDLYLRVSIAPHAEYRVEGSDLIRAVPVPAARAVLGGEAEVVTPDGGVKLKIPAGTQPGQKFRIKGRGLPAGGGERGDFYAEIKVTLPAKLTDEQRALWEKLAASA